MKYNKTTLKHNTQWKALQESSKPNDIILNNTDKGGAVVIQDVKDYIKEADRQLSSP